MTKLSATNTKACCTALAMLVAGLGAAGPAAGAELAVPGDYSGIQAAVEAAEAGDVIIVQPDTYRTNVTIDKEIELRGVETARTLIEAADGEQPAVAVDSTQNVVIRYFTFNTGPVGVSIANSTNTDIFNNVFELGSGATGVEMTDGTSTGEVSYNTFVENGTAINTAADFLIDNNLFSGNNATLETTQGTVDANDNCFDSGQATFGDGPVQGEIAFAAPSLHDYHLREDSACLNTAGDSTLAGAYGGSEADETPFPPQNVGASETSSGDPPVYSIAVEWDPNEWYKTAGYRLYYGSTTSGEYEGTDARDDSSMVVESPVDVGDVTEYTLNELSAPNEAPDAPALEDPLPTNEQLTLNWSEVEGAEGYLVHYGLGSPDENTVEAGDATTYTLEGLQNGSVYQIEVSATSQATYYLAANVLDDDGNESALSAEQSVSIGEPMESGRSNTVTGIPEQVVPYPDLPDQGDSRCFIATAAYSDPNAPPVMALRGFRDRFLKTHAVGRQLVRWYYRYSPPAAGWLERHPDARPWVRGALTPAVWLAERTGGGTPIRPAVLPLAALGLMLVYAGFRLRHE